MNSKYDAKLDRLITHNGVRGMYGNGFHDFMMDELELGARVAMALQEEDQAWWLLIGTPMLKELEHLEKYKK